MKNGMNRSDLKAANQLVSYGWTPAQVSRKIKVKQHVVEAWMDNLTPEGWEKYQAKTLADRKALNNVKQNLTAEQAVALAREQILMEEKIRAEVRAELLEKQNVPAKTQVAQAQVDASEDNEGATAGSEITAALEPEGAKPTKRRRTRKAPTSD